MAVLKHKKWLIVVLVVGVLFWAVPNASFAEDGSNWFLGRVADFAGDVFPYKLQVPLGNLSSVDSEGDVSALGVYISELYKFFVSAAAIVAVVSIMFAGLQRITSQGNPEMISKSNEQITQALFGLAIALLSYVILNTINPQLLRLDALDVDKVNYSGIEISNLAGLCPASQGVLCGTSSAIQQGALAGKPCWGVNRVGYQSKAFDAACEVQGLSRLDLASPESLKTLPFFHTKPFQNYGDRYGAELISALEESGWESFLIPGPNFIFQDRIKDVMLVPRWCREEEGDDFEKPSTEDCVRNGKIDCGEIKVVGYGILKTYNRFNLGTYCDTVNGIRRACVINLDEATFIPGQSDSEGRVSSAFCQTLN